MKVLSFHVLSRFGKPTSLCSAFVLDCPLLAVLLAWGGLHKDRHMIEIQFSPEKTRLNNISVLLFENRTKPGSRNAATQSKHGVIL